MSFLFCLWYLSVRVIVSVYVNLFVMSVCPSSNGLCIFATAYAHPFTTVDAS